MEFQRKNFMLRLWERPEAGENREEGPELSYIWKVCSRLALSRSTVAELIQRAAKPDPTDRDGRAGEKKDRTPERLPPI